MIALIRRIASSPGSLDVATLDLLLNKLSHDLRYAAALLSGYLGQCLVLLRLQKQLRAVKHETPAAGYIIGYITPKPVLRSTI